MTFLINMFKLMMWKNCVIRRRHWIVGIVEVFFPCLIFLMIVLAQRLLTEKSNSSNEKTKPAVVSKPYTPKLLSCFELDSKTNNSKTRIFYTPITQFTDFIINKTKEKLIKDNQNITSINMFEGLKDEQTVEKRFQKFLLKKHFLRLIVIIFDPKAIKNNNFKYTIRIFTRILDGEGNDIDMGGIFMFNTQNRYNIGNFYGLDGTSSYFDQCFLYVQITLDTVYIEKISGKINVKFDNIMMNKFPSPEYKPAVVMVRGIMEVILPFAIQMTICFAFPIIIKDVVSEKRSGAKELMKMMGLRPWIIWVSWLMYANMIYVLVITFATIILTVQFSNDVPPCIDHTNPLLLWIFLFLFLNSTMIMLFVVCAVFSNPLIAILVGLAIYLIPNLVIGMKIIKNNVNVMILCLYPVRAFMEGFEVIFGFNKLDTGVQFNNLLKSPNYDGDEITFGGVLFMFLIDIIIYSLITWYLDNVKPGPFGRAKPWHFIFTPITKRLKKSKGSVQLAEEFVDTDKSNVEKPPAHLEIGLSIRNLTKVYPPGVRAVNGVNLDIYKGQITALLGHNGAGKTTTMSIIAGLFSPTTGDIYLHISDTEQINIFKDMNKFRQNLGLCPQENLLFPYFTVIQHLIFFGMLKGMKKKDAKAAGLNLLETFNILEKRNVTANKLSGGMKRKLSLSIALIGSPKVLILDEPTSGMDPESRRSMWDKLLNTREGRIVIISTHFMEEADVLGDRIAIMDHGKVQCYGTTMFLKKAYGTGYNMTLLTLPKADVSAITKIVTKIVPGSKVKSYHKGQIVYNLPTEESSKFGQLFAEIEKNKKSLFITSIGVSCTTMEDVFLKVGEISDSEGNPHGMPNLGTTSQKSNVKTNERASISQQQLQSQSSGIVSSSNDSRNSNSNTSASRSSSGADKRRNIDQLDGNNYGIEDDNLSTSSPILNDGRDNLYQSDGTNGNPQINDQSISTPPVLDSQSKKIEGWPLIIIQFKILMLKKLRYTYRSKRPIIFFTIFLIFIIIVSVASFSIFGEDHEVDLKLDLSSIYGNSEVFINYVDFNNSKRLVDIYKSLVKHSNVHVSKDKNLSEELVNASKENIQKYNYRVILGVDFSLNSTICFYSYFAYHSPPLSLNLVTNTLLKSFNKHHSITINNYPFSTQKTTKKCSIQSAESDKSSLTSKWGMFVPFALMFLVAVFITMPLYERVNGAKHLQLMTGLSPTVYWVSIFLCDFLVYFSICLLLILPIVIFDQKRMFFNVDAIIVLLIILFFFGLSGITLAYLFSYIIKLPSTAVAYFIFYNIALLIFSGIFEFLIGIFKDVFPKLIKFVEFLLLLNPIYCLGLALRKYCVIAFDKHLCNACLSQFKNDESVLKEINEKYKCKDGQNYFNFERSFFPFIDLTRFLFMLFIDAILLSILILIMQYWNRLFALLRRIWHKDKSIGEGGRDDNLDEDVLVESEKVKEIISLDRDEQTELNTPRPIMVVYNLKKKYRFALPVVNGISFLVNRSECFGLLGINGAGKTTTFKMLTADINPTEGGAIINGYDLKRQRSSYLKQIGYCPQFDSINGLMTGREMIYLFGQLRGIDSKNSHLLTEYWLEYLGLNEYADRQCGTYSGGNQRKLSTAMSLIGDPVIVFLDEPTSGVDPISRRKLWMVLAGCQQAGQSIILTSHSMEECEALCGRLTIMVRGQMVCIGNVEYLKHKFGQGFTIQVKLYSIDEDEDARKKLKGDIEATFAPGCVLKDEHSGLLHYHVTDTTKTWSALFDGMENVKKRNDTIVEDYTVSQTSLEQVFISFAKGARAN